MSNGKEIVVPGVTNRPGETTALTDIGSVYGGGSLMNIDHKDLIGNEIAIKQLMNSHNDQAMRRLQAERRLADKESEIEFLKTSPFVAVLSLIASVCGAIVGGIGVNLATADKPTGYATPLVCLGYGLVLLGGLANMAYPFARSFFNSPRPDPTTRG